MDDGQGSFENYARELRLMYWRKLLEQKNSDKLHDTNASVSGNAETRNSRKPLSF